MQDKPSFGPERQDLLASVVVFLVALPLCMGIALASGVPVAAGLITGIVGGLVVGILGGAPLQVSGPAAGLTVLVIAFVQDPQLGYPLLGTAVLLAGAMQFAAGTFKLGQWFRAVSPAVIRGMLTGIGVLIFASQFHVMVDDKPRSSGWKNLATIPEAIVKGAPLPELGTRESRRFQTKQLVAFGMLHEHQQEIQELVEEAVSRTPTETQSDQQSARLMELAERQADLRESLESLHGVFQSTEIEFADQQRMDDAKVAAQSAIVAVSRAEDDLTEGRITSARDTQREAVEALDGVLAKLKNHEWAAKVGLGAILLIVGWQSLKSPKTQAVACPACGHCCGYARHGGLQIASPLCRGTRPVNRRRPSSELDRSAGSPMGSGRQVGRCLRSRGQCRNASLRHRGRQDAHRTAHELRP